MRLYIILKERQMKSFTVIIGLLFVITCTAQSTYDSSEISLKTKRIVTKIKATNELMGSAVYYDGERPEQYDNFIQLKATATKGELLQLTNHPNGVVRCYSFWALSYDTSANLFPVVLNHLHDSELVRTQFGCIGSRTKTGDFFIEVVTPKYIDLDSKKLDNAQLAEIDSILVYTPNNLYTREEAIRRAKPTEALYRRLRELVINEHNQEALVLLAGYQKEQDIQLILHNREKNNSNFFTYCAISRFPNPVFFLFLEKNLYKTLDDTHYGSDWRELYGAIASYKNEKAVKLLEIPFTQVKDQDIRGYHLDYIFSAIQEFSSPLYDSLLWKLWAGEKKINADVFIYLYAKDPQRAFKIIKQTLNDADDFYYLASSSDYYSNNGKGNLLGTMLDTVVRYDKPLAMRLINKNIRVVNVHVFPTFANKASELKDTSFIASLFIRLYHEDNPHIYLKAAETLITFNNDDINKKLEKAKSVNSELSKDWGGEAFDKLLKEKKIKQ